MSFETFNEDIEMIPESIIDEAARLIREEQISAGQASAKAYKSHFGIQAPKEAISEICTRMQERGQTAKKRKQAEENARIKKEADAYKKAKWGEL